MDLYSLPLGAPPLGECPQSGQGEIPLLGEMSAARTKGSAVFAEEAASGEEKVSTNGRRMRGLPFLKMQDSVRLCVYRELRKSRTLFVKMIFRISLPLIRLGIRRATSPPRGRLIQFKTRSVSHYYSLFSLQFSVFSKKKGARDTRVPP